MKKLFLLSALTCLVVSAKAQSSTYHAFKVDLGLGYAIPAGSNTGGTKGGLTFTLEPHYRLTDAAAVGLRLEGAGLIFEEMEGPGNFHNKAELLGSYCPTFEYYLASGEFRPLIGAGAGVFSQASGNIDYLANVGSRFGAFPRVGFEMGHFRMTAEYNILGNSSDYVAFKIGAFFGGGKKERGH